MRCQTRVARRARRLRRRQGAVTPAVAHARLETILCGSAPLRNPAFACVRRRGSRVRGTRCVARRRVSALVRYAVAGAIGGDTFTPDRQVPREGRVGIEEAQQVAERRDRDHRDAVRAGDLLRGRTLADLRRVTAALLPVERDQDAGRLRAVCADDVDRFAHRGAGADDVVDDDNAAGERRADQRAALAVVLRFLAVEGEADVASLRRQRDGGGRRERNSLVCRAEQQVEGDASFAFGFEQRARIEAGERAERGAVAEQPGVEEVRRQAAGLRAEFAEAQYAALDGEADKLRAQIVCHVRNHREKERVGAMIRVVTLNLNGIRSAARRGWVEWANAQGADVVCVQEVRAQECDLDGATHALDGLHAHFDCGQRKGYSGVGVFARRRPRGVRSGFGSAEFDAEGRYLELDFGSYAVVSVYVPSGSSSPERQAAKFRFLAEFQ